MSKYDGTKTQKNLMAAFSGESEARNKYTYFASVAKKQGFESAKESYLKLFTYTDVNAEMNTEDVLLYAGLTSYVDEQTFSRIKAFFLG